MESYVETLMLMLRNKVLIEQGDLQRVKITWFYPISMAPKRLKNLRETWNSAYNKYFASGQTSNMSESAAPIQYFFRRYANATNLVNVDIGGGTTDIAFARDKEIQYVTSFRFAANSVFENSFSDVDMSNGIVDCYKEQIHRVLTDNKLTELLSIFNSENNVQPSNMASFLFTLKENSMVRGLDSKYVDFNHMLQDDENFKVDSINGYSTFSADNRIAIIPEQITQKQYEQLLTDRYTLQPIPVDTNSTLYVELYELSLSSDNHARLLIQF